MNAANRVVCRTLDFCSGLDESTMEEMATGLETQANMVAANELRRNFSVARLLFQAMRASENATVDAVELSVMAMNEAPVGRGDDVMHDLMVAFAARCLLQVSEDVNVSASSAHGSNASDYDAVYHTNAYALSLSRITVRELQSEEYEYALAYTAATSATSILSASSSRAQQLLFEFVRSTMYSCVPPHSRFAHSYITNYEGSFVVPRTQSLSEAMSDYDRKLGSSANYSAAFIHYRDIPFALALAYFDVAAKDCEHPTSNALKWSVRNVSCVSHLARSHATYVPVDVSTTRINATHGNVVLCARTGEPMNREVDCCAIDTRACDGLGAQGKCSPRELAGTSSPSSAAP